MESRVRRLDLLEPEVLVIILEYIDNSSPHTTISVAQTCKYLNSVVHLVGHRHKTLHLSGDEGVRAVSVKLNQWIKHPDLLHNLRTLTVECGPSKFPEYPELQDLLDHKTIWKPIADFISKLSKLMRLTWNLPSIPIVVLDALHTHHARSAELRMFKFQPSPGAEPNMIDRALAKSPVLTHLRTVRSSSLQIPYLNMQVMAFRRILALAPLKFASLVGQFGDPEEHDPELKIPFRTSKKRNSTLKKLTLDGFCMSKSLLEDWSSTVNLSGLEDVKFSRGFPTVDYFQNAATYLPNLKHISLNLRMAHQRHVLEPELVPAVQHYLTECSPLESLSLWSWQRIVDLDAILEKHGQTLKSLQLHERELVDQTCDFDHRCLTIDQLQTILNSCNLLKDLTLDLNRSTSNLELDANDSNMTCFEILRDAKLDSLQIYFDQGVAWMLGPHDEINQEDSDPDAGESDDIVDIELGATESVAESNSHGIDNEDNESTDEEGEIPAVTRCTKRLKRSRSSVAPSTEKNIRKYVESIWKLVFSQSFGAAKLDVKFGEWESREAIQWNLRAMRNLAGSAGMLYVTARRSERDDQRDQCRISVQRR